MNWGYEWFSHALSIYVVLLDVLLFLFLWKRACPADYFWNHEASADSQKKILAAGTGSLLLAINILLGVVLDCPASFRYVFSAAVLFGYSVLIHGKNVGKTFFVLSVFYNLRSLSFLIATSFYQRIVDFLIGSLNFEQADYLARLHQRLIIGQCILLAAYSLLFTGMMVILNKIMKRDIKMKWQDVCFLSILNIVGIMLTRMVVDLMQVKLGQEVFMLYDNRREMLWKLPLLAALLFMGEISAIYIYQKYIALQKEKEKHFIEEQQVKAMKHRLEEAEQFYGSIRKVRHEMKNHMMNIKGLVAGEQYEAVDSYIARLDETIQELDYKYVTGNPVTDVIMNDKYRMAERLGIAFEVSFYYTEADRVPVFDMGIILNNLLDNAMEACQRVEPEERYIRLTLKRKPPFLLLEVENSFDGAALQYEADGLPGTTKECGRKEEALEHGLGLRNVKDIAEAYLGGLDIKIKGNIFRVVVMLQQEGQE